MPDQNHPTSKKLAPDPARTYERADPKDEPGQGKLDSEEARQSNTADRPHEAVSNRQDGSRQINAHDASTSDAWQPDAKQLHSEGPEARQPDHSMHDEEPDGWDLAPTDITNPQMKRHPRTEGRGGTP